jgi:hypothetical protein
MEYYLEQCKIMVNNLQSEIMNDPPNLSKPHYRCIKTSLKSVVKEQVVIDKLTDAAIRANNIMIHTLQFMKLYFVHCYGTNIPLPVIDKQFVMSVMKTLCKPPTTGRPPSERTKAIKDTLKEFYELHYESSMISELNYRDMTVTLDYLAIDVITMYENNIKQHFVEYVERFVNVSWCKKELLAVIKKYKHTAKERQIATNRLCQQLRRVKNDLLNVHQQKISHSLYHDWINEQRSKILPPRPLRENVYYDLKCSPQDYLPCMIYMMKEIEKRGCTINNVFPLRSEIVPKHFRLDTASLIDLCFTKDNGTRRFYKTEGNLVKCQNIIWGFFFKIMKKPFHILEDKHSYTFDHQIMTDGVSCSILLKRKDLLNKRVHAFKSKDSEEPYIDELKEYSSLTNKRVVAIDPNLSDLLYCVNSDTKDQIKFRYTQDQRRKETKAKKYHNILQEKKDEIVNGKTVSQWEAELSSFNKKTLDFDRFKAYIFKKNEINSHLSTFYNQYLFRKLKLGSYMRHQITEAKMLNRFEKLFGSPEETIIAFGDFEQKQQRKFKEPTKGKGFRDLFRKAGYNVYLVDEFRTSCRCSSCEGECETFRECNNPRPWRSGIILRHGLVKCKTCSKLWNRDTNAASNIWKIATAAIQGKERPKYLQRAKGSISDVTSTPPTKTCMGKTLAKRK